MLSNDEIKHIALLARIGIDEKEIESYQEDLSAVLEYFKKLEEIDTQKVPEIGHITGRNNFFRLDGCELKEETEIQLILKNVPETKDGFIKVKSVL